MLDTPSKSTLVIAQMCWELQTAWTIDVFTLSCTGTVKSSIMQVSQKQNFVPNVEKHVQQFMMCTKHKQQP